MKCFGHNKTDDAAFVRATVLVCTKKGALKFSLIEDKKRTKIEDGY
jgi:hypothetical protein